jgi:hypothetical protein
MGGWNIKSAGRAPIFRLYENFRPLILDVVIFFFGYKISTRAHKVLHATSAAAGNTVQKPFNIGKVLEH